MSDADRIGELLYERWYSLMWEQGTRWIDARRYNLLNTIELGVPGGQVPSRMPVPQDECSSRNLPTTCSPLARRARERLPIRSDRGARADVRGDVEGDVRDFMQFATIGVGSRVGLCASTAAQGYLGHSPNRTENPRVGGSIPSLATRAEQGLTGGHPHLAARLQTREQQVIVEHSLAAAEALPRWLATSSDDRPPTSARFCATLVSRSGNTSSRPSPRSRITAAVHGPIPLMRCSVAAAFGARLLLEHRLVERTRSERLTDAPERRELAGAEANRAQHGRLRAHHAAQRPWRARARIGPSET